ncbi:MAG: isochorismatase family protein [Phenylobacterium sp.]
MTRVLRGPGSEDVLLLCLDALSVAPESDNDGEFGSAASTESWSANAARLLAHARAEGWSVGHVISRRPRPGETPWRPVGDMTPAPSEPVYHRAQPSAFSSPELCDTLAHGSLGEVVLCGVSAQGSCLATALEALRCKLRLTVAADAVLMSAAERAGLEGFIRLQSLGLTRCAVRLASSDGLLQPWERLRLVRGGRA